MLLKLTFAFSALSFLTSVSTLAVLAYGSKRVHEDIQDVRTKSNEAIRKMKAAIIDIQL